MVDYLIIGWAGVVFMVIVRIFTERFFDLAESSVHLLDIFLAPGTDEEKLPTIERRTKRLTGALFAVIGVLLLAFGAAAAFPYAFQEWFVEDRPFAPSGVWNVVALSVGATVPLVLPFGPKGQRASGYSPLAQLLHHLALDNPHVGLRLLRRDVHAARKKNIEPKAQFLIISGLARAGTTSFLNAVMNRGPFVSLNYANMPFVLAPTTWARFYKPKAEVQVERSHGDGVMVGLDSSEALEEVFFKAVTESEYVEEDCLRKHNLSEEAYAQYLDYQAVVRGGKESVYVAKNNNFLLRYASVRALNPDFRMLVLFRDPLTQAASLLEKHLQYIEMQEEDPFVLEYMNWLAHHEFGRGQKPFCFGEDEPLEGDPRAINYWLRLWIEVYSYAAEINDDQTVFVAYEDFCAEPNEVVERALGGLLSVREGQNLAPHTRVRKVEFEADATLLDQAKSLYDQLRAKA